MTTQGGVQYSKIAEIKGPLVIVDDVENAAFDELVEVLTSTGEKRLGKVLEVGNGKAVVQVFEGTTGLSISGTSAKFVGKVMEMPLSEEILGRVFDDHCKFHYLLTSAQNSQTQILKSSMNQKVLV